MWLNKSEDSSSLSILETVCSRRYSKDIFREDAMVFPQQIVCEFNPLFIELEGKGLEWQIKEQFIRINIL